VQELEQDIRDRITTAEVMGVGRVNFAVFQLSDGSSVPVARLLKHVRPYLEDLPAYILRNRRAVAARDVAERPETLAELTRYILGLHEDLRPTIWDETLMDEDDHADMREKVGAAIRIALLDDDPFRTAYSFCRSLELEADIGIVEIARSLLARTAEAETAPESTDRSALRLSETAFERDPAWIQRLARTFAEENRAPAPAPSI